MRISLFRGGFATIYSTEAIDDWDSFVDLVSNPIIGLKNGDYFVRGYCAGARADQSMQSIDMIIIDGDQLETDGSSCCPPDPVHEVMTKNNITHVIYTSYSNDIINGRHKWRLCVPCSDLTDGADLTRGVGEVIGALHNAGLMVRNVTENLTVSQPWFLPRCPEHTIDDFYARWHDGQAYKLGTFQPAAPSAERTPNESTNGQFSWKYVTEQFQAGTLHMGLRAASGWLVRTTDWADSQIVEHLSSIIDMCPDQIKVNRARENNHKEINDLVKFCRKKSGILVADQDISWKAHTITVDVLKDKDFPPVVWAVDGLIPEGLTILAGDPKSGKSLLAVDICSAITSGAMCLGGLSCVEGGAIYVSLEDPERRVRDRIRVQCDKWPHRFVLVTGGINPALEPFLKSADEMLMIYPETRAIVVDVLGFIVPEKPQSVSDYNHYYSVLSPLQKWALSNHIALILITHKSKATAGNGDNPFAGILGSVAIQGCSDCMIMLSKNHEKEKGACKDDHTLPDGFLSVVGREIGAETMPLEFDSEALKWALAINKKPMESGNVNWILIAGVLKINMLTPKEISDETKLNKSTVKSCLRRMVAKGILMDIEGKYGVPGVKYKEEGAGRW